MSGVSSSDGGVDPEIITFTWTQQDACGNETVVAQIVTVLKLQATIDPQGPFCESDEIITLTATPPGGIWTGDIVGDTFDPTQGPGLYEVIYHYTDSTGCEAFDTISIEVIPHVEEDFAKSICSGDSVWINGVPYFAQGIYHDTIPNGAFNGCDSILNIDIIILEHSTNPIFETICAGDEIIINGTEYDATGIYSDTLFDAAANGCDSILTIEIDVLPLEEKEMDVTICENESIIINGREYDTTGVYIDTITALV